MKFAPLCATAAFVALNFAAVPASAASFDEIKAAVDPSAFDQADEKWRRLLVNKVNECGPYAGENVRRIDLIIEKYDALAAAVQADDEAAANAAGREFAALVSKNERFAKCWEKAANRAGLTKRIPHMF